MKKLFVFAIALVSLFATSCSKDEETPAPTPKPVPTELTFEGTLKSVNAGGGAFTQEGKVEFKVINIGTESATLWMYKPQFANGMPARFDMEVKGIARKTSGDDINLVGTNLIPYIGVKPYKDFKMTDLTGTISDEATKLVVEFKCMGHMVTYTGDIKK